MMEKDSNIIVFNNGKAFLSDLCEHIVQAKEKVGLQCMTFEADSVGETVIEALIESKARDKRLLIDSYSLAVVNDVWLNGPSGWLNKQQAYTEFRRLTPLLAKAQKAGVKVKFGNPLGFLWHRYPMRNHKKLMLIDNETHYVGGMNLSEHNLAWADLMIRRDGATALQSCLWNSFNADWQGNPLNQTKIIEEGMEQLYLLNGRKSSSQYNQLLSQIRNSKSIRMVSPYVSYPFLDALVSVEDHLLYLPKQNNKPYIGLFHKLPRYRSLNIHWVNGPMLHMKCMLRNDEEVYYGSSNYDLISYLFEQEIIIRSRNQSLVDSVTSLLKSLV